MVTSRSESFGNVGFADTGLAQTLGGWLCLLPIATAGDRIGASGSRSEEGVWRYDEAPCRARALPRVRRAAALGPRRGLLVYPRDRPRDSALSHIWNRPVRVRYLSRGFRELDRTRRSSLHTRETDRSPTRAGACRNNPPRPPRSPCLVRPQPPPRGALAECHFFPRPIWCCLWAPREASRTADPRPL